MGDGDDLEQVRVAEQRRILDDRCAHQDFGVAGQALHHLLGNAIQVLDFLGQHGAHARFLVARQPFQRFDREVAQMFFFDQQKTGEKPPDLAREFGAHIVFFVVRQEAVRLGRGGGVGRDRPAGGGLAVFREVVKDVLAGIGARGQLMLGRLRALLQKTQRFAGSQFVLLRCDGGFGHCFPLVGEALRHNP